MTGNSSDIFYGGILPSVQRPGRYIGGELNLLSPGYREGDCNVLLAFPDVYELGMSYQGIHVLSRRLAGLEGVNFEFLFAPWPDMEDLLKECEMDLMSNETGTPVRDFDLLGFSLTYELHYTNMLRMLKLAGIPLDSSDRSDDDPLVVAGGPCVMNPLPVMRGLDAVFLGDGEESFTEAVASLRDLKRHDQGRDRMKGGLAGLRGVYVEGISVSASARKYSSKTSEIYSPPYTLPGIDRGWKPVVPNTGIVHDRLIVEVQRGCTRGCRFCQAGILYRPCRERMVGDIATAVQHGIEGSGWEEVSLLSLSTSDYSRLEELADELVPGLRGEKVSLAMPSLRPGTVTDRLIETLSLGKRSGFTIAPEAGTERLRRVINKKITDSEIMQCCRKILENGWRTLKLYFMIGLPTETDEDLDGIVRLIRQVLSIKRNMKLNVTISPFVPKAHTPFQWERQCGIEEIREKEDFLSARLDDRRLNLQLRNPEVSVLEGVMARGGAELWQVLCEAVRMGAKFEGWTEHFNFGIWIKAMARYGLSPEEFISGIETEAELPWSKFDTLVSRRFLLRERQKAYREEVTLDCRESACSGCGVCDEIVPEAEKQGNGLEETAAGQAGEPAGRHEQPREKSPQPVYFRYRCVFSKTGKIRFVSHRDMVDVIRRAVKRTGLPVCYSRGYHPQSRISMSPPLAVGMEGENEFFDIKLCRRSDFDPEIFDTLLPDGMRVKHCLGPFAKKDGKLPPDSLFHYYLDFSLITLIIESEEANIGSDPEMRRFRLLGQALGLEERPEQLAFGSEPACRLKDELEVMFNREESIIDRRGRKRSTRGCRTGKLEGDLLEVYLKAENGVGVTPRDLLNIYLPGKLVPLVKVRRLAMYFMRGGEYLNPVELVN